MLLYFKHPCGSCETWLAGAKRAQQCCSSMSRRWRNDRAKLIKNAEKIGMCGVCSSGQMHASVCLCVWTPGSWWESLKHRYISGSHGNLVHTNEVNDTRLTWPPRETKHGWKVLHSQMTILNIRGQLIPNARSFSSLNSEINSSFPADWLFKYL